MKVCLAVLLLAFSSLAQAKHFFMMVEGTQSECLFSDQKGIKELQMSLEAPLDDSLKNKKQKATKCTRTENKGKKDFPGTNVMTCTGPVSSTYVFAKNESDCESLHKIYKGEMVN